MFYDILRSARSASVSTLQDLADVALLTALRDSRR